ncbi:hypothetical protein EC973_000660 [Apophysomyces ossiformis]|uniref:DUF605-domain-containing protein n=1 Tax=Apophysomyces ossiformis TaxID=679940 RepID=A0A8H7BWZ0_9FUNG|nr:hypothetical protein EC973_000660 [Apophysomyces ossiformis]
MVYPIDSYLAWLSLQVLVPAHYYAVKLAISRGPSNKDTKTYLGQLLDSLEQRKVALAGNEAITDDIAGYAYVENFALKVFLNADNEDRAGNASKKTAKNFLAASTFLELLKTFGELDPEAGVEVEEKIKYAKWKATDIMKALREGRRPVSGPPGGDQVDDAEMQQESLPSAIVPEVTFQQTPSIAEFPTPPSNFTAPLPTPSTASQEQQPEAPSPPAPSTTQPHSFDMLPPPPPTAIPGPSFQPPTPVTPTETGQIHPSAPPSTNGTSSTNLPAFMPSAQQTQVSSTTTAPQRVSSGTIIPDPATIASAQKKAKWAISALNYDDVPTARLQLLGALEDLGFNQSNNFGFY